MFTEKEKDTIIIALGLLLGVTSSPTYEEIKEILNIVEKLQ